MIKNYFFNIILYFVIIFVCSIVISLIHYFSIFNDNIIHILKIIVPIMAILLSSFRIGRCASKNGSLEGLKFGGIIIFITLLISLVSKSFNIKSLIFYIILLISSMLGSMVGITRKNKG